MPLKNLIVEFVENFFEAKEVLPNIIRRNLLKKGAQLAKITLQVPNY